MIRTERLFLRELEEGDRKNLRELLQDREVMYAYEHAFTEEEVVQWYNKQQERYREPGFGLMAVIDRYNGDWLGQAGLTRQKCGSRIVVEIGYLFKKSCWGRGYALEAARACRDYAFSQEICTELYAIIRENNQASRRVAERLGMCPGETIIRHYYGMDMPHIVYSMANDVG